MTIYSPPQNYIVFNGKNLTDFDVYVSGEGTFLSPEREFESVTVPGKNGDLLYDSGRYKNVTVTYPAFILENLKNNMIGLREWLLSAPGYSKLEDTYHPEEYRLAAFAGPIDLGDVYWLDTGTFDLSFNCKPQRYLKTGDVATTIIGQETLHNRTLFSAKPLLKVYGTGIVTVGEYSFEVLAHQNEYINVDCELQDCYYGTENCNNYVRLTNAEFPQLKPGTSVINCGEGITKIDIYPRWWML